MTAPRDIFTDESPCCGGTCAAEIERLRAMLLRTMVPCDVGMHPAGHCCRTEFSLAAGDIGRHGFCRDCAAHWTDGHEEGCPLDSAAGDTP